MIKLALSLAVVVASPAAAEDAVPKPAKEKKICRVIDETGSNMPRRTCRTRTDWTKTDAAQAKTSERGSEKPRGNSRSNVPSPNSN
jgi:hypothetical protein